MSLRNDIKSLFALISLKEQRRNQSHPSFVWTSYPSLNTCVRRDGSHKASAVSRVLPIHCSCEAEWHGNMLCDSSSLWEPTPTPEARIHDFLQNWPPPKGPISKDRGGGSWGFKLRLSWWCFMDHKLGNCARLDDMSFFYLLHLTVFDKWTILNRRFFVHFQPHCLLIPK